MSWVRTYGSMDTGAGERLQSGFDGSGTSIEAKGHGCDAGSILCTDDIVDTGDELRWLSVKSLLLFFRHRLLTPEEVPVPSALRTLTPMRLALLARPTVLPAEVPET